MNGISGISFQETPTGLSMHVRKSAGAGSGGKKKRLPYSFKQMSKQIQQAKTAAVARPVVNQMRAKLSWLYKRLKSGEYNESEVFAAIIHAATMERIAKRKVRHLEEEEAAEQHAAPANAPGEEGGIYGKEELEDAIAQNEDISEEMIEQMAEQIEELEEELASETMSELQDMLSCASGDMSEEEIADIKRKHRSDEERQLTHADLKYLKALFDRLEQEKREAASGAVRTTEQSGGTINVASPADTLTDIGLTDEGVAGVVDLAV